MLFELSLEPACSLGGLELREGFRLDLAYALAGDAEPPGHFLEGARMLPFQTEPQLDDLALTEGQRGQRVVHRILVELCGHSVEGPDRLLVFDEVAEFGVFFIPDRSRQRDG